MAEFWLNGSEIYDGSATNLASKAAILACNPVGVRTQQELKNYCPSTPGTYSRTIITGQARWLAQNGFKMQMILGYGPPNTAGWQALGGDWEGYNIAEWRAVRPPAGTANAVWIAEADAYIDMINTARAEFEAEDLDPAVYLQISYMNEPRNVTKDSSGDTHENDGTIDDHFHDRAEVQVPLIVAAHPDLFLWSPTVWRTHEGESALLEPYIDHWASNAADKTAYASQFDGWCFNAYPNYSVQFAVNERDSFNLHMRLFNDICDHFRSKDVLGMDTKPLGCHEFGLSPLEGGMTTFGRPDNDQYLGRLRAAGCQAVANASCITMGAFYRVLDDAGSEAETDRRHGFVASDGSARSSLIPMARLAGNNLTTPPAGFANAGEDWEVSATESQP